MGFPTIDYNISSINEMAPIFDILKFKEVNNLYHVNCNHQERILYHKMFNYNDISAGSLDVNFDAPHQIPYTFIIIGIILNTSCSNWTQAFNYFPPKLLFKNQYKWLVVTDDLENTGNILANYSIEIDSDVTILINKGGVFDLYEVFHIDYSDVNTPFTVKQVGHWNGTLHMNIIPRRDLNGLVMKSPVVVTDKITQETFGAYIRKSKKKRIDSLHRLKFISLLDYIGDMFNISYEFERTNSWGYIRNGSFDGVAGRLQRQEADVGGSPLFFRADRSELIDYIAETWQSRQCFILRHPKHPGGFYTIYTRPLTGTVWCCIGCIFAVSGVILYLMLRTKSRAATDDTECSFSMALLFHWSAVCQQGMTVNRNSTSVKIVVIVTFVYAVTLYQYYNAMVVSTLLREPPKNIRTLDDLLRSGLKAGAENVLYAKDYFKRTTDPVALRMYHKRIAPANQYNFYSPERGMALVQQGGFAFHVDSVVAYRIMRSTFKENEICEAHEILLYPPQKMGVVVRKYSPYREIFSYGVRAAWEAGLSRRLQARWDAARPGCVRTPDAGALAVSLREFSTALLALLAGAIAAAAILLAEIAADRCRPRVTPFTH